MRGLQNQSIRVRLLLLVAMATAGLLLCLMLSAWMLARFRVGGPIYQTLAQKKELEAEVLPPPLYLVEPFLVAHQLVDAAGSPEVQPLEFQFRKLMDEFRARHELWVSKIPASEPLYRLLLVDAYEPAEQFEKLVNQGLIPAVRGGDASKAREVLQKTLAPLYARHREAIDRTVDLLRKQTLEVEQGTNRGLTFWMTTMSILGLGLLIGVTFMGAILARGVVKQTSELTDRVTALASGEVDLSARLQESSQNELGRLAGGVNAVIQKVQEMVSSIRTESVELRAASTQIASSAIQQEKTIQSLETASNEISTAIAEISSNSEELSSTMRQVNGQTMEVTSLAMQGLVELNEVEEKMSGLITASGSVAEQFDAIRQRSEMIDMAVTTITKVADQTNLLSLNAAIEAEKAGDAGRGFLVVAREIRRLADQTAEATLDIENVVSQMRSSIKEGSHRIENLSGVVTNSVESVSRASNRNGKIIDAVRTVLERFEHINDSMSEQTTAARLIRDNIAGLANAAEESALAVGEFKQSAAGLRDAVERLDTRVANYRT